MIGPERTTEFYLPTFVSWNRNEVLLAVGELHPGELISRWSHTASEFELTMFQAKCSTPFQRTRLSRNSIPHVELALIVSNERDAESVNTLCA